MSVQSQFFILRKLKGITLENLSEKNRKRVDEVVTIYSEDEKYRLERAQRAQKAIDEGKDEWFKPTPNDLKPREPDIPRFIGLHDNYFYDYEKKEVYFELWNDHYISTFRALPEKYSLSLDGKKSQRLFSIEESAAINRAAKYLLSGEYSRTAEGFVDSEFLDDFKDMVPAYQDRNRNKGLCLFIERQSEDTWKITDSVHEDSLYGDEDDESYFLKKLSFTTELFMKLQDDCYESCGDSHDDIVLLYEMC